jgi:hypothetical protein
LLEGTGGNYRKAYARLYLATIYSGHFSNAGWQDHSIITGRDKQTNELMKLEVGLFLI